MQAVDAGAREAFALLGKDDIKKFTRRSDLRAALMLAGNWAMIAGALALAALWPNPLSAIAAVIILAGRQLGLAVLMHECAHLSFFKARRVNEFVGRWLCALPINASYDAYRPYHLKHHGHIGTEKDPDLILIAGYPATPASMRRKLLRDLTGRTGLRDLIGQMKRMSKQRWARFLGFQLGFFAVLLAVGAGWTYALWWVALLFVFPALTRIRLIGEHGVAPDRVSAEPRDNTVTTIPNFFERLLFAPNYVSYHLEHHLIPTVPNYRLRAMHRTLKERGYFKGRDCIVRGYRDVLSRAVSEDGHEKGGTGEGAKDLSEGAQRRAMKAAAES